MITYRINCHEANAYFLACRVNREKPTWAGLVVYVRACRNVA